MEIRTKSYQQTGSISIHGKFDFQLHRKFKQTYTEMLDNPAIQEIEVEMQHLDFLDSAALGMLMLLRERAHAVNKSILLSNPTASVFKLLEVANFDKIFPMKRATYFPEDISNWSPQAT
ncbi:MAG TPA: anti-anti-sigma factor [Gallionellaceae bacterium]|nr:anti-anti-sigma factor [Gallionellaceae bacterium]